MKKRGHYAKAASRDRCKRGHVYTSATVYEYEGRRYCKPCQAMRGRKYREKKKLPQTFADD